MVASLALALAACSSSAGSAGNDHHARSTTTTSQGAAPPATTTSAAAGTAAEWTTYGGGPLRQSIDGAEGPLGHAPAPAWTSPTLDGAVYGEPLIFGGQVLVATENDTVYSLSATSGSVTWALHLATPVSSGTLPCGDISPTVGITSTMVIDPASDTLYTSAETVSPGDGAAHQLYAVDLATHAVRFSRDLDQPGWTATAELQRAALALDGGSVVVSFGGLYGDCGRYNGWVIGVPASGSGALLTYKVPSQREAGIWEPGGPSVDGAGNVYVTTGNGSSQSTYDHGNSVIELSPQLAELQHFADPDWGNDNEADADLGSTSPLLLGDGRLFQVGKQAVGYLVNTTPLGSSARSLSLCNSRGATAYQQPDLYVVCTDEGRITEVRVGTGGSLQKGWTWSSPTGGAGSPTLARGVLWSLDPGRDVLYGLDPASGVARYAVDLDVGGLTHFASPAAGEGMIVVAGTKAVEALH